MLTLVDSYVHFWDPDHLRYDWLGPLPPLKEKLFHQTAARF